MKNISTTIFTIFFLFLFGFSLSAQKSEQLLRQLKQLVAYTDNDFKDIKDAELRKEKPEGIGSKLFGSKEITYYKTSFSLEGAFKNEIKVDKDGASFIAYFGKENDNAETLFNQLLEKLKHSIAPDLYDSKEKLDKEAIFSLKDDPYTDIKLVLLSKNSEKPTVSRVQIIVKGL